MEMKYDIAQVEQPEKKSFSLSFPTFLLLTALIVTGLANGFLCRKLLQQEEKNHALRNQIEHVIAMIESNLSNEEKQNKETVAELKLDTLDSINVSARNSKQLAGSDVEYIMTELQRVNATVRDMWEQVNMNSKQCDTNINQIEENISSLFVVASNVSDMEDILYNFTAALVNVVGMNNDKIEDLVKSVQNITRTMETNASLNTQSYEVKTEERIKSLAGNVTNISAKMEMYSNWLLEWRHEIDSLGRTLNGNITSSLGELKSQVTILQHESVWMKEQIKEILLAD